MRYLFGSYICFYGYWTLILGIVNTGLGCMLYFSSIGNLSFQTIAVCGYIEPLSAVLFSVVLLKEKMTPIQIIGAVIILFGIVICENIIGILKN